jgi:hypothetical protein
MLVWGFGGDGQCRRHGPTTHSSTNGRRCRLRTTPSPTRRRTIDPRLALAVYDPTNDVFFLLKLNPTEPQNDIGYWPKSLVGEMWAYRYSSPQITAGPPTSQEPPRAQLAQNTPNPFQRATSIPFELRTRTRVQLRVYDIHGRVVATLADKTMEGLQEIHWDGRNTQGHEVASGVYWYELKAGPFRAAKKMVLLR